MKKIQFALFCFFISTLHAQISSPSCAPVVYKLGNTSAEIFHITTVNASSTSSITLPAMSVGWAIGPSFGLGSLDPTYWLVANDTLWYAATSAFVKTNFHFGNVNASGLGATNNHLYSLDAGTGQVYKFNGLTNPVFLTTIPSYTNSGLVQDLVGDSQDNFFVMDLQSPQALYFYNSTGSVMCSYSLSGIPTSTLASSFAIHENTVSVQVGANYFIGLISGGEVSFTLSANGQSSSLDYASCPLPNTFSSAIVANSTACLSGSTSLSAICSETNVSYSWSGPGIIGSNNSSSVLINQAGVYSCTLQSTACFPKHSISQFTVYSEPTLTLSGNYSVCEGHSVSVIASGASTYTWFPGAQQGSSVFLSPTVTTIFTVSGTDGNGCSSSSLFTVTVFQNPTLTVVSSPPTICNGAVSTLSASGAQSFSWSPGGQSMPVFTVSPSGTTTYTVVGSDINGCLVSQSVLLTVFSLPQLTVSLVDPSVCEGFSTSATVGGAQSYSWSASTATGSTLVVGGPVGLNVFTVTGTDTNGCIANSSFSLLVNPNPTLAVFATSGGICSGNSGTVGASGATSYTWNPGAFVGSVVAVSPSVTTVYTVIGKDANGCVSSSAAAMSVTQTPILSVLASTPAICLGASASFVASGADAYSWQPVGLSGSSITVTPLVSTTYTLTGLNGVCVNSTTVNVAVNSIPNLTLSSVGQSSICSGKTGTLVANGASVYNWLPGNLTGSNVIVSPSVTTVFSVTGISNAGCSATGLLTLTVNVTPTVTAIPTPSSMCENHIYTVTASGANSYYWLQTMNYNSTLSMAAWQTTTHTVIGTIGSCSSAAVASIIVNPQPTVMVVASSNSYCVGEVATFTASGALSYTWVTSTLTESLNISTTSFTSPGYYVHMANGENIFGCVAGHAVFFTVTPTPTIVVTSLPPNYNFICSGATANLLSYGATSYTWQPGSFTGTSNIVSPSATAVYTVSGTNSSGCVSYWPTTYTVNVTPTPSLYTSSDTFYACGSAAASITANGATSYSWMPGNLTGSVVAVLPSSATVYTILGKNGVCSDQKTVTVIPATVPVLSITSTGTSVCTGSSATLQVTGASNYTWNPGSIVSQSLVISPSVSSVFTVSGTYTTGCASDDMFAITVISTPTLTVVASPILQCAGKTFSISASGAPSFTWNPGNIIAATTTVAPWVNTTYTVTGANGPCFDQKLVTLSVQPAPTLVVGTTGANSVCAGSNITFTAGGANSYTWLPGNIQGTTSTYTPLATTVYSVVGSNSLGCIKSETFSPTVVNVSVMANSPGVICAGEPSTLVVSGAHSYSWNTGDTSSTVVVYPTNTTSYSVTGSSFGCQGDLIVITQSVNACLGTTNASWDRKAFAVIPNPGEGIFQVNTDNFSASLIIRVFDSHGNLLLEKDLMQETIVDLRNQAKGIYMFIVYDRQVVVAKRKVIKL